MWAQIGAQLYRMSLYAVDMACWRKIKVHNKNEMFKDEWTVKNVLILPG